MKHELRKMAEERMTSRLATMPMFKDLDSSQVPVRRNLSGCNRVRSRVRARVFVSRTSAVT